MVFVKMNDSPHTLKQLIDDLKSSILRYTEESWAGVLSLKTQLTQLIIILWFKIQVSQLAQSFRLQQQKGEAVIGVSRINS